MSFVKFASVDGGKCVRHQARLVETRTDAETRDQFIPLVCAKTDPHLTGSESTPAHQLVRCRSVEHVHSNG